MNAERGKSEVDTDPRQALEQAMSAGEDLADYIQDRMPEDDAAKDLLQAWDELDAYVREFVL